ncbi:MAG: hypothetical protein IJE88_04270 [Akkermansia sp.]|nr:hypothetical protein [Akkermansia sp.]
MERLEEHAAEANRIAAAEVDACREHNERMQQLKEREIEDKRFVLTLRGDEARDYNEWKELRGKHRELLQATAAILSLSLFIDRAIEFWISPDPYSYELFEKQDVLEYVKSYCRVINGNLCPHLGGKVLLPFATFSKEDTTNQLLKILRHDPHQN